MLGPVRHLHPRRHDEDSTHPSRSALLLSALLVGALLLLPHTLDTRDSAKTPPVRVALSKPCFETRDGRTVVPVNVEFLDPDELDTTITVQSGHTTHQFIVSRRPSPPTPANATPTTATTADTRSPLAASMSTDETQAPHHARSAVGSLSAPAETTAETGSGILVQRRLSSELSPPGRNVSPVEVRALRVVFPDTNSGPCTVAALGATSP